MNSVFRVTVLLTVLAAICTAQIVDFHMEPPCASAGGQCIMKDECTNEIEAKYLGLCPEQQKQGAECCHGTSKKEYRCQRLGGECFPQAEACRDQHRVKKATDCSPGTVCCMLF